MIKVGLIGAGFVARLRAAALVADVRSHLAAVADLSLEHAAQFAAPLGADAYDNWQALVERLDLDLIIISTPNHTHGDLVAAALQSGKHVVVEYPLSLQVAQAEQLIALARQSQRVLHIEHVEQLGGQHQALKAHMAAVGQPLYSRYCTLDPQRPTSTKWTYHPDQFGFPLVGALSRLSRLIDLFGPVAQVACQNQYSGWQPAAPEYSTGCLCTAQLRFASGLIAEVTYGKGEAIWDSVRRLEIHGRGGGLICDGDAGQLVTPTTQQALDLGSRRGLFAKDTNAVLDCLSEGTPLYSQPEDSLYALRVADAARQAAEQGQSVNLS